MNAQLKVAPARHPRYVHSHFQNFLKQQGLRAPVRKRYAAWLCRFIVFHHGFPIEKLSARQVDHFLQFLNIFEENEEQDLAEARYCLRLFFEVFLPTLNAKALKGTAARPVPKVKAG